MSKLNIINTGYFWIESNPLFHTTAKTPTSTDLVVFIDETSLRDGYFPNEVSINCLYENSSHLLAEKGIFSLLYISSNKTSLRNDKEPNTLDQQTEKLVDLLETFFEKYGIFEKITLIGSEVGAHIAVGVVTKTRIKKFKISKLVLLSPPAYPRGIDNIPFGQEFETELASFEKFKSAPIFERLKRFCSLGRDLLIGFWENDNLLISNEVQNHFFGLRPKERNIKMRVNKNRRGDFRTLKMRDNSHEPKNEETEKITKEVINFICSNTNH